MNQIVPVRGHIYQAALDGTVRNWLVISNNARNRALGSCMVAPIFTSLKPELPSIVELGLKDPVVGRVMCDHVGTMYRDEIQAEVGELPLETMMRVATGLKHAQAI